MVWFYRHFRFSALRRWERFQSHYGLILSGLWDNEIVSELTVFQSHYGLILSKICCSYLRWGVKTFNPTMVWFYPVVPRFRLRSRFRTPFNPTMVWFYQLEYEVESVEQSFLSIPLWSDFINASICYSIISMNKLSIPLWSDFIWMKSWACYSCSSPFNPTMVWFYPCNFRTIQLFP